MTQEKQTLLDIQALTNNLRPDAKAKVTECAEKLRGIIEEYAGHGRAALALVGAEYAAEE